MTKKKALAAILAAALVICVCVGATLAYLQDKTLVATNTFTVGKVDITLDETKLDENGEPTEERTAEGEGNEYHLLPGLTYTKDPVVTVKANSEECYVRAFVTLDHADKIYEIYKNHNMTLDSALSFFGGYDKTVWTPVEMSSALIQGDKITVEFRYKETVKTSTDDTRLPAIIKTITLPEWVNNADTELLSDGFKVEVYAEAIQAKGFDDAVAAWKEFDEEVAEYNVPTSVEP